VFLDATMTIVGTAVVFWAQGSSTAYLPPHKNALDVLDELISELQSVGPVTSAQLRIWRKSDARKGQRGMGSTLHASYPRTMARWMIHTRALLCQRWPGSPRDRGASPGWGVALLRRLRRVNRGCWLVPRCRGRQGEAVERKLKNLFTTCVTCDSVVFDQ